MKGPESWTITSADILTLARYAYGRQQAPDALEELASRDWPPRDARDFLALADQALHRPGFSPRPRP